MGSPFLLKHFEVQHERSAMKVGTDAFILGSWLQVGEDTEHILDVGTGCGIIALLLAQRSEARIDAIDMDKPSVDEAALNFKNTPWHSRLSAIHSSFQDYRPDPEKKYDLIVSNPPFFNRSLLPESDRLILAKHTISFPIEVFITKSFKFLENNGRLAVVLPVEESVDFHKMATKVGFFEFRMLEIYPKSEKPMNRKVLVFSKSEVDNPEAESLLIRDSGGKYTDQYKTLTRDFHAEGHV